MIRWYFITDWLGFFQSLYNILHFSIVRNFYKRFSFNPKLILFITAMRFNNKLFMLSSSHCKIIPSNFSKITESNQSIEIERSSFQKRFWRLTNPKWKLNHPQQETLLLWVTQILLKILKLEFFRKKLKNLNYKENNGKSLMTRPISRS